MYTKLFLSLLYSFFSILLYAYSPPSVLKVGCVYENAPYTSLSTDKTPEGFSIDLAKTIMEQAGLQYEFVFYNIDEIYDKLKSGEIDVAVYMARTKDRMIEKIYFSSPYITPDQVIVTKTEQPIYKLSDMDGKRIIVKRHTITHRYLMQLGLKYSDLLLVSNTREGLLLLANNEGDCFITTNSNARELIKENNLTGLTLQSADLPLVDICFASAERGLMVRINEALVKSVASRKYDKIYYNWFGQSADKTVKTRYLYYTLLALFISVVLFVFVYLLLKHRVKVAVEKSNLSNKKIIELSQTLGMLFMGDEAIEVFMYDCESKLYYQYIDGDYKHIEITNQQVLEQVHPDDLEVYSSIEMQVDAGAEIVKERIHSYNPRLNKYCWYEYVMAIAEKSDKGQPVKYVVSRRDCSDSEAKITEKNELIAELNDALRIGKLLCWRYDIAMKTNFITDSFGSTMVYGVDGKSSSLHDDNYIISAECKLKIEAFITTVINGGGSDHELEIKVYDKINQACCYFRVSGTLRIDNQGNPYEISGVWKNITKSKLWEAELRELRQKSDIILQHTNSGVVYLDLDYTVRWSNIASVYGSIDGNTYQVGRKCYEGFGRTSPCDQCRISDAVSYNVPLDSVVDGHNGTKYEVIAIPIVEDDELKGITMKFEDRTEYYQLIDDLKEAHKKAETSDRLKSAFLANMSHEIRTPLNAIVGFSGLLAIADNEKERDEYNEIINTNNELLLQLIGDIMDLSKIEAGAVDIYPSLFDFSLFFDQSFTSFTTNNARKLNPNVQIISSNPLPHCYVELDKNRCLQIYTNFVNNAIKYTHEGTIIVGYELVNDGLLLFVEDTGIGIRQEDIDKLFNRFEKLNSFVQGTGLGLSICKAIAEVMGGKVGLESEYGKGSRFWAWLPCSVQTTLEIPEA